MLLDKEADRTLSCIHLSDVQFFHDR